MGPHGNGLHDVCMPFVTTRDHQNHSETSPLDITAFVTLTYRAAMPHRRLNIMCLYKVSSSITETCREHASLEIKGIILIKILNMS